MRFLLDENIPGHTEDFLRQNAHEAFRAAYRADDREILNTSHSRNAVVITRDRDFLNFLPSPLSGIIYVPIHPSIAEHITDALRDFLTALKPEKLLGRVWILHRDGYELFS